MTEDQSAVTAEPVSLSLPFTPRSAGIARHELQHWLTAIGSAQNVADDCRLVLSELVGNAVRHARPLADGTLTIAWCGGEGYVCIAVTDGGGSTVPDRIDAGLSALAGRGLLIVEALAEQWWTESTRARSTVHALLPLP